MTTLPPTISSDPETMRAMLLLLAEGDEASEVMVRNALAGSRYAAEWCRWTIADRPDPTLDTRKDNMTTSETILRNAPELDRADIRSFLALREDAASAGDVDTVVTVNIALGLVPVPALDRARAQTRIRRFLLSELDSGEEVGAR